MDLAWRLARRLADGCFHSGESLAAEFCVTRATVWNALQTMRDRGLEIHAVRGKGYRLPAALDWLDEERIATGLPTALRDRVAVQVLPEADSTNARLLAAPPPAPGRAAVCLAEYQSGGRGRRGRRWLSPPGAGIYLSLAWQFDRPPANLSALSIVAGLAIREALLGLGARGLMIKWPNDLVVDGGKLGGLLVELRAEGNGPCHAVIGVGINYRLPAALAEEVERTGGIVPVDLTTVCEGEPPDRNIAAGAMVAHMMARLDRLTVEDVTRLCADWKEADALGGRMVIVEIGERRVSGCAAGIESDGALRLERSGEMLRVTAGDVKVRPE